MTKYAHWLKELHTNGAQTTLDENIKNLAASQLQELDATISVLPSIAPGVQPEQHTGRLDLQELSTLRWTEDQRALFERVTHQAPEEVLRSLEQARDGVSKVCHMSKVLPFLDKKLLLGHLSTM